MRKLRCEVGLREHNDPLNPTGSSSRARSLTLLSDDLLAILRAAYSLKSTFNLTSMAIQSSAAAHRTFGCPRNKIIAESPSPLVEEFAANDEDDGASQRE